LAGTGSGPAESGARCSVGVPGRLLSVVEDSGVGLPTPERLRPKTARTAMGLMLPGRGALSGLMMDPRVAGPE
jgi:hypothetical protein